MVPSELDRGEPHVGCAPHATAGCPSPCGNVAEVQAQTGMEAVAEAEAEARAEAEAKAEAEAEAWRVLELVGLRGRMEGLPERLHTDVVAADLSEVSHVVSGKQ